MTNDKWIQKYCKQKSLVFDIMNSLHKKRQALRQSIRSRSIQELFARKRQELLHELKQQSLSNQGEHEGYHQKFHPHTTIGGLLDSPTQKVFDNLKHFLSAFTQYLTPLDQELLFSQITRNKNSLSSLQKVYLLSKLINREQFALNHSIESQYGWKNIIQDFLTVILNDEHNIQEGIMDRQIVVRYGDFQSNFQQNHIKRAYLHNMICFSLLKIWEIKPKYEYFLILTKSYQIIHQKVSSQLSLTLIAELSYDRSLLPNYSFVIKLLEVNVKHEKEVKFFRTLEILKNFISQFKVQNDHQIHPRQLLFQYFNWIKAQINLLLDQDSPNISQKQQLQSHKFYPKLHSQTSSETKYFFIYLLFTVLNKLSEVNEAQRHYLHNKQILVLNEQLLNFKDNHTLLKFLIFQGKQSLDSHHKKNILKTLSFLIGFLETISSMSKQKESQNEDQTQIINKQLQFGAQLQEIQKAFQDTELEWFGSFN